VNDENRIPLVDLVAQFRTIEPEVRRRLDATLTRGDFILGQELAEFESAFALFCECRRAVGVASGLDALKLALRALEIGPGDEVITVANSFIATALAITAVGAKPVLVDCDPDTFTMDPSQIEAAITDRTRAVLPVHLYGRPADIDAIRAICQRHGLYLVEDAAQAHGARYRGRRCGSLGTLAAFSFYPGKNLGAYGDGGAVTTNDEALADRIATLRNYGSKVKYVHELCGENSRLDTLQAAVLNAKLAHLDAWNARRRELAARYAELLQGVGDLQLPKARADVEPVWHLYVIRTSYRDRLLAWLQERGIGALIHYPVPIHLQPAYAHMGWKRGQFPVAEHLAQEILSLPIYPEMTEAQLDRVVAVIREFFERAV
jgi:dTDP-4-amino-4,6-dideoxygalactose transaminase